MNRANAWTTYEEADLKALEELCKEYKDFLSNGKTERECVAQSIELAEKAGYQDLEELIKNQTPLKAGDKVYRTWMEKTIVLFQIGEDAIEDGLNILGAHIDSPRLDLKQNPLYEDDIDNIVGVLYLKDVIDAYLNQKEAKLSDIAREPFFVHQTMNLSVLFQEMQTKKIHMAIVIDEYSQTEGIVSMEDMLEVIVGNILDEYDVEDRNITKIGWADVYLVRGSTRLEELEDTLGIEFDVEDIETLNGFLIDQLGHLPEDNEEIEIIYQGYSFKSVDIHDNMIRQVKVEKRKRKEEKDVRTQ